MTDIILESVRSLVLLGLVLFLLRLGITKVRPTGVGWNMVIGGLVLLLFGSVIDITDNFDSLNRFVIIGNTETEAFLEKFVGFLGGFILLTIGLVQWVPSVRQMEAEIGNRKQAEESLLESEELLKAVIKSSPGAVVIRDLGGRNLMVNGEFSEWYAVDKDEIIGKTMADYLPAEIVEEIAIQERAVAETRRTVLAERQVTFPDGVTRDVFSQKFPIFAPDGDRLAIGTIVTDITERKRSEEALRKARDEFEARVEERTRELTDEIANHRQTEKELRRAKERAEEAEELFSKIFRSSPIHFAVSSPKDGRHIDVNDMWSSTMGYSHEEAMENTVFELDIWVNPKDRKGFVGQIKNQGFIRNYETVFRTKNGAEKDLLLSAELISYKGEDCLLVAGQDISERKAIERMKNEFISIASHELRTPLTSLKGALGLLHSDVVGKIPEAMEPMLEVAYRNSERLGRLIDDILDMEKLDAEKMEISMLPLSVLSLIDQAISEHAGYGIEHGVSFVIEGDVPNVSVLGDEDRLMQVFSNLMSNAAKFSPKGTVVRLSAREGGQDVRISVMDEGIGIPKEFHEKIFEKFSRADNSNSGQHYGTGLGLSIAKAVIELHGGDLGFKTETDVGTTFFFDLPKAANLPNP